MAHETRMTAPAVWPVLLYSTADTRTRAHSSWAGALLSGTMWSGSWWAGRCLWSLSCFLPPSWRPFILSRTRTSYFPARPGSGRPTKRHWWLTKKFCRCSSGSTHTVSTLQLLARRTTTSIDVFVSSLRSIFLETGILACLLVVILAQLMPQIVAAKHPVAFLEISIMRLGYTACILLESTGV